MPYNNSITEQVISIVRDTWGNDEMSGDDWTDDATQEEIFNFINDPASICTPGFILRRHIQSNFPDILQEAAINSNVTGYADLTQNNNVAWSDTLVHELARVLQQTQFDMINNLGVEARQWENFLSDKATCNRETAIKIIFALELDESTAAKFLIANDKNIFSTRNPVDYFCRFCLKCGLSYDTAMELVKKFETKRHAAGNAAKQAPVPNATTLLENETERISRSGKLHANAILKYALKYQNEFVEKNKDKYPSGFSRQNTAKLKILLKYLTELYPQFLQYNETGKFDAELVRVDVAQNKDGSPKSPIHLTTAMNNRQEIYLWELEALLDDDAPPISDEEAQSLTAKDVQPDPEDLRKAQNVFKSIPFNQNILLPLKNLSVTLRANLRGEDHPNNAKDVERSTILFLTYFFICACYNLGESELLKLSNKLGLEIQNNPDDAVGNNLRYSLKSIVNNIEDNTDDDEKFQFYVDSLDTVLESFHCSKLYLPFLVDRVVLLCLLQAHDYKDENKNVDNLPQYLMTQLIDVSFEFSKQIYNVEKDTSNAVT